MDGLTEEESAIVSLVAEFVDREVRPVVQELEHANTYPEKLIDQMKEMGIFGLAIPEHPAGRARPRLLGQQGPAEARLQGRRKLRALL
jgi:alkylation response protein AidB-like acyl-CoA dehydrogenase